MNASFLVGIFIRWDIAVVTHFSITSSIRPPDAVAREQRGKGKARPFSLLRRKVVASRQIQGGAENRKRPVVIAFRLLGIWIPDRAVLHRQQIQQAW